MFKYFPCFRSVHRPPVTTFSYVANTDAGEEAWVYIYKNGKEMAETVHFTHYSNQGYGWVGSTGGRAVYLRLGAGDTLTLQIGSKSGKMYRIMFCVQFINN